MLLTQTERQKILQAMVTLNMQDYTPQLLDCLEDPGVDNILNLLCIFSHTQFNRGVMHVSESLNTYMKRGHNGN